MVNIPSKKEGDVYLEDHGEQTVVTPQATASNPHNFGPASARDTIVFTCERPGGDPPQKNSKIDTKTKVAEWVQFMTNGGRNIRHVFILLTDKELDDYAEPGLIQAYKEAGIIVHHIPYASPKSYQAIMKELDEIHALGGEQAVAHCTHGMGRSGRVAAGWLVYKYGLGVDQAVEEALEAARAAGVQRMGSPRQLTDWIAE